MERQIAATASDLILALPELVRSIPRETSSKRGNDSPSFGEPFRSAAKGLKGSRYCRRRQSSRRLVIDDRSILNTHEKGMNDVTD